MGLPFRRGIEQIGRLGAKGVLFDAAGELAPKNLTQTGRRHLSHIIRSHELELTGIGFVARHGFDQVDRLEARVAGALETLTLAHDLRAPIVVAAIGSIPPSDSPPGTFHDALITLARSAERLGVQLAIQTAQDSPEQIAMLLRDLASPGLGVYYSVANLLMRGRNPYDSLAPLAETIAGIEVADLVRTTTNVSGFNSVPLGTGELDLPRLVAAMEEIAYQGPWTLGLDPNDRPLDRAAEGIARLKTL